MKNLLILLALTLPTLPHNDITIGMTCGAILVAVLSLIDDIIAFFEDIR